MTIKTGDPLPATKLWLVAQDEATETDHEVDAATYFQGKRALLFAVPGAFTPVCSLQHLPGYIAQAAEFQAKGIELYCLSVNDPFVLRAWGQQIGTQGKVHLLADANAEFVKALGLDVDLTAGGLGVRSKRFAMTLEDGKVGDIQVDASTGECKLASAEFMIDRTA